MEEKRLEMYGGLWGGLIPLVVLVGGLIWLSVEERGGTKPFWACAWIALCVGLFFARDKAEYCRAAMRGIGDKTGIVIVTAWLLAGVFGKLMAAGGLVDGLLWMGMTTGAQGSVFVLLVFVAAMLFALGTGTSTGTCIALAPVLYPAGYFLGCDPAMLGLAILSGAAFGDNLAPISDTTIVSAYTQGAEMRDVVRSRFPLAMAAACVAGVVFLIFGGGGEVRALPEIRASLRPEGLVMLVALAVVVVSALRGRHIMESLIYGNVAAAILGVLVGTIKVSDIFRIPAEKGGSTGLIQVWYRQRGGGDHLCHPDSGRDANSHRERHHAPHPRFRPEHVGIHRASGRAFHRRRDHSGIHPHFGQRPCGTAGRPRHRPAHR